MQVSLTLLCLEKVLKERPNHYYVDEFPEALVADIMHRKAYQLRKT